MLDKQDREAADDYGPWGWIGGYVIGFILMALMFTLASGWR
jgi:hypothetical protein